VATYNFYEPQRVGSSNMLSPWEIGYAAAQNAQFKRGDLLQLIATGTVTLPNPNGSISTSVGPSPAGPFNLVTSSTSLVSGPVTIAASTSAGAPAQTYYCFLTYQGAANIEGVPGQEFIINCNAGLVPTITVTNVGAPASTTGNGVYVGLLPGYECQQAVTAFASTTTLAYPLTNYQGVNVSVTNPNSNLVGVAVNGSDRLYFSSGGGSFAQGGNSQFGSTMNFAPLSPGEELLNYVDKFQNGQLFEFSLKQALYPQLFPSTAGFTLDSSTGIWVVDTGASHKIATIIGPAQGVVVQPYGQPVPVTGSTGDIGARVIVYVSTASALA